MTGHLREDQHPLIGLVFEAWRNKQPMIKVEHHGEDLIKYYQALQETIEVPQEYMESFRKEASSEFYNLYYFDQGFVYAFTGQRFTADDDRILERFTQVFDLAYRRFLDLHKAEARAREAQIEAALERVRSRSMGMQKSDELREVIQLVFEQFVHLGFDIDSAQFDPTFRETDDLNMWTAVPGQPYSFNIHVPYFDHIVFNDIKAAKKSTKDFLMSLYSFEEKNEFFKHFFDHVPSIPKERQQYIFNCPGLARSTVFLESINLGIQNYSGTPFTDAENSILKRFGKVFEQTYTRFLDLQKAEAQAREAQIEAALERVRAQTMAMHKTDDLREVVGILYEQVKLLHLADEGCNINIFKEDIHSIESWMAAFDGISLPDCYYIAGMGHPFLKRQWDKWRVQAAPFHISSAGKELEKYSKYIVEETDLKRIPDNIKDMMLAIPELHFSFITFKYGQLEIVNSVEPPSHENLQILTRFAKVFEQTYTRFLDLQKAEAQARESEIQLALERVRLAAMAMHKSREIKEVTLVLHEQLQKLGLIDSNEKVQIQETEEGSEVIVSWSTDFGAEGEFIYNEIDIHDNPKFEQVYNYFCNIPKEKRKSQQLVLDYTGKDLENLAYWAVDNKILSQEEAEYIIETYDTYYDHYALYAHGSLVVSKFKRLTDDQMAILQRFAGVFEQAYTRFLDLQKAEAQAREAEIQLALERVRSAAMAMHKSEELSETIGILFDQLTDLGVNPINTYLVLYDLKNNQFNFRMTGKRGKQVILRNDHFL